MSDRTALDKVRQVLQLWCKVFANLRMRDRSLKMMQYGCQLLLGYYGGRMSFMVRNQVKSLQGNASLSRKAFWLLKSVDQMGSAMRMFEQGYWDENSTMSQKLDLIEQFFLIWYYWCETLVFFAKAKMFNLREHSLDFWCNTSWLGGDIVFFTARLLELRSNVMERNQIDDKIKDGSSNNSSSSAGECKVYLNLKAVPLGGWSVLGHWVVHYTALVSLYHPPHSQYHTMPYTY